MNSENFKKGKLNSISSDSEYYNTIASQKSFFTNIETINVSQFQHGQIAFEDGLQRLRQVKIKTLYKSFVLIRIKI